MKYGNIFDIDWMLLMAQGYQESTLTISSDKAQEYVAKRPTLNIMNVEYVIE
jgi:hypothetical protein